MPTGKRLQSSYDLLELNKKKFDYFPSLLLNSIISTSFPLNVPFVIVGLKLGSSFGNIWPRGLDSAYTYTTVAIDTTNMAKSSIANFMYYMD